jgi:hypothetical protein
MADRKMSAFEELTAPGISDADYVPLLDTSAGATAAGNKKFSIASLRSLLMTNFIPAIISNKWVTEPRINDKAVSLRTLSDMVLEILGASNAAGLWTPASGAFPSGAIAGNQYIVTAAGTVGGQGFTVGDTLVALVNSASTSVFAGNWMRIQRNSVTQSTTDVTSGRLLKVGDYGFGGAALSTTDWNAAVISNAVYSALDAANAPASGVWFVGSFKQHLTSAYGEQTLTQFTGVASEPRIYTRLLSNGVWGPWRQVYTQNRIVGTVSQSGGIPTGAIIERGSNANGEYVKCADGTMICTHKVTATQLGVYYIRGTWNFPATFIAAPTVQVTPDVSSAVGYGTATNRDRWGHASAVSPGTATALVDVYRSYGAPDIPAGATMDIAVTAIGRWF